VMHDLRMPVKEWKGKAVKEDLQALKLLVPDSLP